MSDSAHTQDGQHEEQVGHVVPVRFLWFIGGLLLFLTWLTVYTAKGHDFGALEIWVALAIALLKAGLVACYFMHLRWDSPFNAVVLIASLLFVVLFIGLALTDTKEYQPTVIPYETWQEQFGQ